jgi:hypothetical protein
MVLLYGPPDDFCSCRVYELLQDWGAEVIRWQGPQELTGMGLSWPVGDGVGRSYLALGGGTVLLTQLSGVLLRGQPPVSRSDLGSPGEDGHYIAAERRAALVGLWNALPCRVVNRPIPGGLRRPLLAAGAASQMLRCGFRLPAMQLTSDADEAVAFYRRCGQRALLSSPSGRDLWRSVRGKQGAEEIEAALARHPIVLQELPDGEWLQLFTVGDRAFGTLAPAELLGGGSDQGPLRAVELSVWLQERCCRLARAFRLDFAQLQLLRTERGELYCLDLSALPDPSRCGPPLQQQITAALATLLLGGDERSADDPASWRPGRSGDGLRLHASVSHR